jgi:hypothetical protein
MPDEKQREEAASGDSSNNVTRPWERVAKGMRKKVIAAFAFILTSIAALVVHDLYDKAKTTVGATPPVSVSFALDDECPHGEWLFPENFDPRTLPGFDRLDSEWAYEHGGYNVESSVLELTLQGGSEQAVILRDMSIDVVERKDPVPGVVISKCPIITKDAVDVRRFESDLDNPSPLVVPAEMTSKKAVRTDSEAVPFRGFPYKVSLFEPEVIQLVAHTANCSCTWRAELNWTSAGESGSVAVGTGSAPFRTTTKGAARVLYYHQDGSLGDR